MRRLPSLFAVAVLAVTLGAPGCGPTPQFVPPSDSCAMATAGSIDSVELGSAAALGGSTATFTPLMDGNAVTLVHGGQGATMLGFVLRVTGAAAPTCLGQKTVVTDSSGTFVASAPAPVTTYAEPDGTRVTHPMWLPAAYPLSIVVSVTALDQTLAVHLSVAP